MARLWMEESDGERWLINSPLENPALIVANPRKKRRSRKMAYRRRRSRKNRMPAGLARYWAKHRRNPHRRRRSSMHNRRRRRARRNFISPGMVAMNRPRRNRRSSRRRRGFLMNRRHRRHARRNPSLMGFSLPPMMDVAAISAGMIGTPMLANYIFNNFVAGTSMGTSKWAYIGTEAVSVAALGFGIKRFVNVRAGNLVLLGGAARVAMDLITMLAPTLLPSTAMPTGLSGQPFLGMYERMPQRRALGRYYSRGQAENSSGSRMIQGTPDRLDPSARF